MTGKVIDRSAAGLLILILPFAFLSILVYKAWPELLALVVIIISFRVWQQYQWKQWSKQVNPFFNQLIKENQGCLTAIDLSMKANLSGAAARRYLDKKAEEFGAQRRDYDGKGTVYYFLTASALGSLFEESEPDFELESESFTSQAPQLPEPLIETKPDASRSESSTSDLLEPVEVSEKHDASSSEQEFSSDQLESVEVSEKHDASSSEQEFSSDRLEAVEVSEKHDASSSETGFSTAEIEAALEPMPQPELEQTKSLDEEKDLWRDVPEQEQETPKALIQAELAKRLDVHSSTVGKRKSDPDFPEWSQSRDPEGIAWEYSPETKEFVPVEKPPELGG